MVWPTIGKPEGGFQFISVMQLYAVWHAYDSKHIRITDVRLWCAAQEMAARRCQLLSGQQPKYRQAELTRLVGKGEGLTAALERLQTANLLIWKETGLTFPQHEQSPDISLSAMFVQIPNYRRRVPVPRRLLRFIAKGCSRVVFATILGHLFRCLYYRQGQCRTEGFCKASWIARVFGVSERGVKMARHQLEALGFLQRIEIPQWVRNRYGQKMVINLRWDDHARKEAVTSESRDENAPPISSEAHVNAPPNLNRKLLSEQKHQEPTSGRSAGMLSKLVAQVQRNMRNGILPIIEEPLALRRKNTQENMSITPLTPNTCRFRSLAPPQLTHVILPDLQDMARLLTLYTQAVQRHLIGSSEADRLAFIALAQHVLRFRPENPGGLLLQLLKQQHFNFITQEEEDTARQRLKTYMYSDPPQYSFRKGERSVPKMKAPFEGKGAESERNPGLPR